MSIGKLLNCVSYWRHLKHSYTLGKPFTMICKVKKKKFFWTPWEMAFKGWGRGEGEGQSLYPVPPQDWEKHAQGLGFEKRDRIS